MQYLLLHLLLLLPGPMRKGPFYDTLVCTVPEAKVRFTLPNEHWQWHNRVEVNHRTVYTYKREPITDSAGRNIIPNIAIIVENAPDEKDVVAYSVQKRGDVPFDVTEMFMYQDGKIHFQNAVGYKGKYVEGGIEHTVFVVHALNSHMGIQLILDATSEIFRQIEPEFTRTLKSFQRMQVSQKTK
jgi:hypothetical protein